MFAKATVLAESGDTKAAIAVFEEIEAQKKTTTGQKVDIAFSKLRIAFAGDDLPLMTKAIEKAKEFVEVGGDWERRNRLKVLQSMSLFFCGLFFFFLFSCGFAVDFCRRFTKQCTSRARATSLRLPTCSSTASPHSLLSSSLITPALSSTRPQQL
jgi:hypothetical protein